MCCRGIQRGSLDLLGDEQLVSVFTDVLKEQIILMGYDGIGTEGS